MKEAKTAKKVNKTTKQLRENSRYKNRVLEKRYLNRVPIYFCTLFNMTTTELLVYCQIKYCTDLELQAYTGSVEALCEICNVSKPTVRKALARLVADGFVFWGYYNMKNKKRVVYRGNNIEAYGTNSPEDALAIWRMRKPDYNGKIWKMPEEVKRRYNL